VRGHLEIGICNLGFGILSFGLTQFQLDWIHMLSLDEILEKLPHGYPFRMIDRILEIEPGKKAVAIKNVSVGEPHFSGHFPGDPIMPGILILEALAQAGGLAFHSQEETQGGGIPILARVEAFRLKGKVVPGDRLILEAEVLRVFSNLAKVKVLARVGEEPVAEGTLILAKASTVPG
jgi:3-hydroxyacyl-[acyl-carrier-protein] dehydratase